MTTKIRIKVGAVEVEYEGPEAFLNKKLPELISQLQSLATQVPESVPASESEQHEASSNVGTLASFLKSCKVGNNATRKFLATAEWLHRRGTKRLATGDVKKALSDAHQSVPKNVSQCLNTNVSSGYCEKDGKNFYVTDEGRGSLG